MYKSRKEAKSGTEKQTGSYARKPKEYNTGPFSGYRKDSLAHTDRNTQLESKTRGRQLDTAVSH